MLRCDLVEADHFRAPVILPVLAIASCGLLLWQQEGRTWLFAGILLAVGGGLYVLARAPWWRNEPDTTDETAVAEPVG